MRHVAIGLLLLMTVACNGPASLPEESTSALTVDPASLDLGGEPSGSFDVGTSEPWHAAASESWLEISPTEGVGPTRLTVTAHREALAPDTYLAEVVVTSGEHEVVTPVTSRFPTIDVQAAPSTASSAEHAAPASVAGYWTTGGDDRHPSELVVTLDVRADQARSGAEVALAVLALDHGATVLRSVFMDTRTVATLRTTGDLEHALQRLRDDSRVRSVAPSVRIEMLGSDPLADRQAWHYGQINLEQAWLTTLGSSGVTAAVIDSGFDLLHEDLTANLRTGYDFGDPDADDAHADTLACGDHGTHVAGTVGAALNGLGGTGVAPVVTIVPLKVGRHNVETELCEIWSSALLDAIYHAAGEDVSGALSLDGPVDVINLSLGLGHYYAPLHEAVQFAVDRGVTIVAASGNSGELGVIYPAAHPEVIAVGATNARSERASYSSYGPELSLMAPGGEGRVSVISTRWSETHDAYGGMQGTSMASPHVAGVVALMKSVNPALAPSTLQHILQSTAMDIGDEGWDERTGFGIVDAEAAVLAAQAYVPVDEPDDDEPIDDEPIDDEPVDDPRDALTFRLYALDGNGSRTLLAESTSASALRYPQADFGPYLAEAGVDSDGNGVLGEPGEWYGSKAFDVSPDEGDRSITIQLTLQ